MGMLDIIHLKPHFISFHTLQVFVANTDPRTAVTNTFDRILVKAIRIRPQSWSYWIHIRMELLGCVAGNILCIF